MGQMDSTAPAKTTGASDATAARRNAAARMATQAAAARELTADRASRAQQGRSRTCQTAGMWETCKFRQATGTPGGIWSRSTGRQP